VNLGIYKVGAGITYCRQLSPVRHHAQFEAAKLLAFECFAVETASAVKGENVKRHPYHPCRLLIDELDDSLDCSYPLSCELRIPVPRRIAAHLVHLRNGDSMNTIASINQSHS
jgi:hypothetical protein